MKAHIVGGGFGGLAAAAYLIRNAGVSGQDITIYEADERMGGGFSLGGSAQTGYSLPTLRRVDGERELPCVKHRFREEGLGWRLGPAGSEAEGARALPQRRGTREIFLRTC
jgi:glycine/D-amino acid oxidase-like deaminating enzyme